MWGSFTLWRHHEGTRQGDTLPDLQLPQRLQPRGGYAGVQRVEPLSCLSLSQAYAQVYASPRGPHHTHALLSTHAARCHTRVQARFWTEIYDGAKLFYLSGVQHGGSCPGIIRPSSWPVAACALRALQCSLPWEHSSGGPVLCSGAVLWCTVSARSTAAQRRRWGRLGAAPEISAGAMLEPVGVPETGGARSHPHPHPHPYLHRDFIPHLYPNPYCADKHLKREALTLTHTFTVTKTISHTPTRAAQAST